MPSNLSPSALQQLLSSNGELHDHVPESEGGDNSLLKEIRILRNEVNELREKYGELKGKFDSLLDLFNRDLNRFKDELNNSLVQQFAISNQEVDRKITSSANSLWSEINSFRSEVASAMQNMQDAISQVYNIVHNNPPI